MIELILVTLGIGALGLYLFFIFVRNLIYNSDIEEAKQWEQYEQDGKIFWRVKNEESEN